MKYCNDVLVHSVDCLHVSIFSGDEFIWETLRELSARLKIPSRIAKRIEKQSLHGTSKLLKAVKKARTSSLLRLDDKELAVLDFVKILLRTYYRYLCTFIFNFLDILKMPIYRSSRTHPKFFVT
jgi:hypothetical protein